MRIAHQTAYLYSAKPIV